MIGSAKVTLSELDRAVDFCKNKLKALDVTVTIGINGRLEILAYDLTSNPVRIILYDTDTGKFPEIIKQESLP